MAWKRSSVRSRSGPPSNPPIISLLQRRVIFLPSSASSSSTSKGFVKKMVVDFSPFLNLPALLLRLLIGHPAWIAALEGTHVHAENQGIDAVIALAGYRIEGESTSVSEDAGKVPAAQESRRHAR